MPESFEPTKDELVKLRGLTANPEWDVLEDYLQRMRESMAEQNDLDRDPDARNERCGIRIMCQEILDLPEWVRQELDRQEIPDLTE